MTLRLRAEDEEDLRVLSAHVQDAILRPGDIAYLPKQRRLALMLIRFCWEALPKAGRKGPYRRVTAGLHFDDVLRVRSRGFSLMDKEALLNLLAVTFTRTGEIEGVVEFQFSGGGVISAEVECLDATLKDQGEPWLTESRPKHNEGDAS